MRHFDVIISDIILLSLLSSSCMQIMFSIELLPQYDTVTYIAIQPHFLWYRMDIGNSQQRCRQNEDEVNACVVVVVVVVVVAATATKPFAEIIIILCDHNTGLLLVEFAEKRVSHR